MSIVYFLRFESITFRVVLTFLLAYFSVNVLAAAHTFDIPESDQGISMTPHLHIHQSSTHEVLDIITAEKKDNHTLFNHIDEFEKTQWLALTLKNSSEIDTSFKLNFIFTDIIDFYVFDEQYKLIKHSKTGDLTPLREREVFSGIMVFNTVNIPANQTMHIYVRLESVTDISYQFKTFTLKSINLFPEHVFEQRFNKERLFQALFYGALLIMLFYNIFLYISLKVKSYLYYNLFLASLIVFLSSNSGYLAEIFFYDTPRIDLYIRFISPACVIIFFILFSVVFLDVKKQNRMLRRIGDYLIYALITAALCMAVGMWKAGRTTIIIIALLSFGYILFLSIRSLKRGYKPARYFLAANILLIIGGVFFAYERLSESVQNELTQHAIQIALAFEVALFSIGLASRINQIRKELAASILENEILERSRVEERRLLIEDKNKALEKSNQELDTFIYKTAHDIKGPLARLLGLSYTALMEVNDPISREYFERFYYDSNHLNTILTRLSKLHEISNAAVELEEVDLIQVIDKVLDKHKSQINNTKVYYEIERKQAKIMTDAVLIEFVINDLVDNALKFKKDNGEASILSFVLGKEDNHLQLSVIDNGIGIKDEDKDHLFDMFTKSAGIHKSIGLGLYMVNLVMQKLEGDIVLKDNAEGFTEFVIKLPTNRGK